MDGGSWQSSGATVSGLSVGSHAVTYQAAGGYTAPSSESVTITANQTTTLSRAYVAIPSGSLTVTLTPSGVGAWNVDGGSWQSSGATVSGLSVGSHTVNFSDDSQYNTPASLSVKIAKGKVTKATGKYTPKYGSLTVTISPAGAANAGATWSLDNGNAQAGGSTLSNVDPGSHTLTFSTIQGWNTPKSQTVKITAGKTVTKKGTYTVVK